MADNLFSIHMDKIKTIKLLPDEQIGQVIRTLIEYQETGENPVLDNPSSGFAFEILKQSLDILNQKRVEFSKKQSERVKKRWEKGNTENNQNIPSNTEQYQTIPEDTAVYSGIPENTEEYQSIPDNTNTVTVKETETEKVVVVLIPPLVNLIKQEALKHGFFLDTRVINRLQKCGIDTSWLINQHTFLEFCAERVRKKYPKKTNDELKPIFLSALRTWEDLRDEYPSWLTDKMRQEGEKIKKAEQDKARKNHPTKCEFCGGEDFREFDDSFQCKKCYSISTFNKDAMKWECRE